MMRIVQSWDTAIKTGLAHDASACATFAEKEGVHYLLEMRVMKLEFGALLRCIEEQAQRFTPQAVLIEDKASGQSLLQELRRKARSTPYIAVMPRGDKVMRFASIAPMIEAGQVALPHDAPWLGEFERELMQFPNATHDDQVDAFCQYLQWARERANSNACLRRI